MQIALNYLWVGVGGALGSIFRYWLGGFIDGHAGGTFPWGTVVINVTGSFCIGFLNEVTGADGVFLVPTHIRTGLMIGILGGYTTFSSFSLQTLNLYRTGEVLRAGGNVTISLLGCLTAVWLGAVAGRYLNFRS